MEPSFAQSTSFLSAFVYDLPAIDITTVLGIAQQGVVDPRHDPAWDTLTPK